MPRAKWNSSYTDPKQQTLYKSLIDQCVKFFGLDVIYIPRVSLTSPDLLFGEDPTKAFVGAYTMAMYLENTQGFEGPSNQFLKFGFVISKEARLLLGNNEWTSVTAGAYGPRPREGDLLWFKPFQAIHEITFVDQDKFFYAFGANTFYGWSLMTEQFVYNNEIIKTGFSEIDSKVNQVVSQYSANVSNANLSIAISFAAGEQVTQGNVSANVVSFNRPSGTLILKDLTGDFVFNTVVHGVSTGAIWTLNTITLDDNLAKPLANSAILRIEANTDLDQSESNPIQGNPVLAINQES